MAIKVDGDFSALVVEIAQTGERARKNAARRMGLEAERVAELARDYAPVDTHALEESIKIERYQDDGAGGRVTWLVYVDGGHTKIVDGKEKNVGEYALMQHEGLVRAPNGGWSHSWHPGPGTIKKMAETGNLCGPKFLERAMDEREVEIEKSVFNAVRES